MGWKRDGAEGGWEARRLPCRGRVGGRQGGHLSGASVRGLLRFLPSCWDGLSDWPTAE